MMQLSTDNDEVVGCGVAEGVFSEVGYAVT